MEITLEIDVLSNVNPGIIYSKGVCIALILWNLINNLLKLHKTAC